MAKTTLPKLDRFIQVVQEDRTPNPTFHLFWQRFAEAIEDAIKGLEDADAAIEAALEAAGIAIQAAADAQQAADNAQQAANDAQSGADGAGSVASLTDSGTADLTLDAIDAGATATIQISAHSRVYGNGTIVSVNAGTISGLDHDTYYYIYYDDPTRTGGAVSYQATTIEANAAQINDRHLVGAVRTPEIGNPPELGAVKPGPGLGGLRREQML